MQLLHDNPELSFALIAAFFLVASMAGGVFRVLAAITLVRRVIFFAIPFTAGAGGMMYLLN